MARNKPCYLKSRNIHFPTKEKFRDRLCEILENGKGLPRITDEKDILDLKDFIQDYCDKSEHLQEMFDLDNCFFQVKKSTGYSTECLFIVDNDNEALSEEIGIRRFGNPPTEFANFKQLFNYVISDLKKEKRVQMCNDCGYSISDWDLVHISPTTEQLAEEFLQSKNLMEKVSEIISPNNQGNHIPELQEPYRSQELDKEIYIFYKLKLENGLLPDLRKRKNH